MDEFLLVAPCHFGTESVLKREIQNLGYETVQVEDGRVTFKGDAQAVCRANVFLRTAERVLIQVGRIKAKTYDQLFEEVKKLEWEHYIPVDGRFWVKKASTVKSALFSPSDIQKIVKKAIVERMKTKYHASWFPETGDEYPIRVFFYKDEALLALDTSGESLHKRGYRKNTVKAPISETLAAALIMLTPWKGDRILVDPFCGCGTFPIEAAMMAANIAPGKDRKFAAFAWTNIIDKAMWLEAAAEAKDLENLDIKTDIQGYDIDEKAVDYARKNAANEGVQNLIHFQKRDVKDLSHSGKYGFIITNPPYGERLDNDQIGEIYADLGKRYIELNNWSLYVITAYEKAQEDIGIKAAKNRKIYNGMIKTYFYQFPGEKPPRQNKKYDREEG